MEQIYYLFMKFNITIIFYMWLPINISSRNDFIYQQYVVDWFQWTMFR